MLEKLLFYTRHSFNDLRVNGQRTIFALLCVAAGVAAIVSLQTLGVMIEDSLTGNLQESNKSDIRLTPASHNRSNESIVAHSDAYDNIYITMNGINELQKWFADRYPDQEVTITYRQFELGLMGTSVSIPAKERDKTFVASNIIEADKYPLYGEVETEDGTPLSELLKDSKSIVFSRNLADDLDAKVGDVVRLNGVSQEFTLRGIVPTNAEAGFENMMGALLGFYYLDTSALQYYTDAEVGAESVFIKLEDPSNVAEISKALERSFNYLDTFSTADLEEQNSEISKYLNQLVIVMGLISLLIGGIGIINTMLVIVSRRTTEVAVLKTVGLEAGQVTVLFLVEALIMGFFGSIIGVGLGWLAALGLKGVAGAFLSQDLTFRITTTPAVTGIIVGIIVTAIFGFLPTLAAGQVRPNLVLRPSDTVVPQAGRARSFVALILVLVSVSLVAQVLVRDLLDSDQLRSMAQMVGAALGVLSGLAILGGSLFATWTHGNMGLRILRWLLFLVALPLFGYMFGNWVPAILLLSGTFIIVGILYVLLWTLIWSIGGGSYSDLWLLKYRRNRPAAVELTQLERLLRWMRNSFATLWGKVLIPLLALVVVPVVLVIWIINLALVILMTPFWLLGRVIQKLAFIDLKLSMKSMVSAKGRGASTLLALVIGVFTLSLITMLVKAITNRFDEIMQTEVGGNLVVFAAGTESAFAQLDGKLQELQDQGMVRSYAAVSSYSAQFKSYLDSETGNKISSMRVLQDRTEEPEAEEGSYASWYLSGVDGRDVRSNLPEADLYAGRHLNATDTGPWDEAQDQYPPIVISVSQGMIDAGFTIGDRLTLRFDDFDSTQTITFVIVGMVDRTAESLSVNFGSMSYAPADVFSGLNLIPTNVNAVVDAKEDQMPKVRRAILEVPLAFPMETRDLNDLINRIIEQFTSFPTLVAALALFTGGIVIANSVALATIERRREIATMKAVGLQRERVLVMILLEYGLMGLIGGLIGVGIGGLILLFMLTSMFQGELGNSIPYMTALGLMSLCVAIALLAAILTAWRASGERPLNVLRYE